MSNVFHDGEIAVQKAAGVEEMAKRIGGSLKQTMHPVAQKFLSESHFVIVASAAKDSTVWASVLYGDTGFVGASNEKRVSIRPSVIDEILERNIKETGRIGILAIEFSTRLRMRLNGTAAIKSGVIEIMAEEVFSNCQKYIQAREPIFHYGIPDEGLPSVGVSLTTGQRRVISNSDTFFIASFQSERGADASHRGGNPGFVRVTDKKTLFWPDYAGNMMFQTLGNLNDNGRAGLLFIDFATGSTIQTSGLAEIVWDKREFSDLPGAERAVRFHVEKVIEKDGALPADWSFIDYSPSNPPID